MQNTGTRNSDLAILFFFCLIAPISMYFLGGLLQMMSREQPAPRPAPPQPRKKKHKQPVKTTNKKTKRFTPPKKIKPKPQEPITGNDIINEAAGALVQLGYKKREAVKVVQSIAVKKRYNSAESLIKDCFMCIS